MKEFIKLFKKANGVDILKEYAKSRNLIFSLFLSLILGLDKKSLEIVRLAVSNRFFKKLRKKYKGYDSEISITHYDEDILRKRVVWVCWLQGMENAPLLVQQCYKSILKHICDREVIVITADNFADYVKFPEYILEKYKRGIISNTHFSDLLRLELLKCYGGTWIDATVFVSGKLPSYMLDSDLFLFQNLKPGLDGHCTSISSWFISAKAHNEIIQYVLQCLYIYWKNNDAIQPYFIIHNFFQIAIEKYPNIWNKVIPFSNSTPHILLFRLNEEFDEAMWDSIKSQTPVHKLSNKILFYKNKNTYYSNIILK